MDLRSLNYIMLRLTSWVVKHSHPAVMDVFRGNPVCLMSCAHASLINFSVLTFRSSNSQIIRSFLAARETENRNTSLGENSLRCQFVRLSGFSVSAADQFRSCLGNCRALQRVYIIVSQFPTGLFSEAQIYHSDGVREQTGLEVTRHKCAAWEGIHEGLANKAKKILNEAFYASTRAELNILF
jgi:hypothetical protein